MVPCSAGWVTTISSFALQYSCRVLSERRQFTVRHSQVDDKYPCKDVKMQFEQGCGAGINVPPHHARWWYRFPSVSWLRSAKVALLVA